MKKQTHKEADIEPQELLKSYNKKIKTRDSSNEKEDNLPSTRSVKTDPTKRSYFGSNGRNLLLLEFF